MARLISHTFAVRNALGRGYPAGPFHLLEWRVLPLFDIEASRTFQTCCSDWIWGNGTSTVHAGETGPLEVQDIEDLEPDELCRDCTRSYSVQPS
jgi:hypothetical protein